MRFLLIFTIALSACSGMSGRKPDSDDLANGNRLQPFTTDGCSNFPDGLPFFRPAQWRECCIVHDIAYWQGGTSTQREQADRALAECVAEKSGERALAEAMYYGVRVGGHNSLPTTWHWGYGWVQDRGTLPLDEAEQAQVASLMPVDPLSEPIQNPGVVRDRKSLTGDYCLDIAIQHLRGKIGPNFKVLEDKLSFTDTAEGTLHQREIRVEGREAPYRFEFLLLQASACTTPMNELVARGRIRLKKTPKD